MYWNNLEIDTRVYPANCPGCGAAKWQDKDWETGLVYCLSCGWYAGMGEAREGGQSPGP